MSNTLASAREFGGFLARVWRLIYPYWTSSQWRPAWFFLLCVLVILGILLFLMARMSFATAAMFNALNGGDADAMLNTVLIWLGYVLALLMIFTIQVHVQYKLIIHWRRYLTEKYLTRYLGNHRYNLLELGEFNLDNPDQRISVDMLNVAQETLELGLEFISVFGRLFVFSVILWTVSGALEFTLFGVDIIVPGYMFWAAVLFSILGTWLAHVLGHPLSRLNFKKQAVEADYRFHLVRLRENTESIALLEGEKKEYDALGTKFSSIWDNWMHIIKYKARMMAFNFGLGQGGTAVPFLAAIPALQAGTITFGSFMQLSQAFMSVQTALSWFAMSYEKLAVWKSSIDRVLTFDDALDKASVEQTKSGISRQVSSNGMFELDGLTLTLPTGKPLLKNSNLTLEKGTDVLISGPSGSGKSTLFRLFSGLWIWGDGNIHVPEERIMFIPQKPYLPIASLREVLTYPNHQRARIEEARLHEVMRLCQLDSFIDALDKTAEWARILSGGEQQRVSLARAFLAKPDWLFLDEATSAMDPETEAAIYRALKTELPHTTMVSIAHRESLRRHHDLELKLEPATASLSSAAITSA